MMSFFNFKAVRLLGFGFVASTALSIVGLAMADTNGQRVAGDERASSENLLRQMTGEGIRLTDQKSFVLPPPTFVSIEGTPVETADAEKALAAIAGRHGVDRFARDSVVAPIATATDSIDDESGVRIGHLIDVTFVVHQSIAEIRQSKTLDRFRSDPDSAEASTAEKTSGFAGQDEPDEIEKNKTRSLTKQERIDSGVQLEGEYEALGYVQMPVLSKVLVRGVARARRSVWSDDDPNAPILLTWLLDSRFSSESPQAESISNQWRAIERTSVGEKKLGAPHPYAGMGGYVVITSMPGNAAASIVQLRFVIHEPQGWFEGRNLLRSKLPILIQDRVRNLRRELQQ